MRIEASRTGEHRRVTLEVMVDAKAAGRPAGHDCEAFTHKPQYVGKHHGAVASERLDVCGGKSGFDKWASSYLASSVALGAAISEETGFHMTTSKQALEGKGLGITSARTFEEQTSSMIHERASILRAQCCRSPQPRPKCRVRDPLHRIVDE